MVGEGKKERKEKYKGKKKAKMFTSKTVIEKKEPLPISIG